MWDTFPHHENYRGILITIPSVQVISPQRIPATVAPTLLLSPSVFSQAKSSGSLSADAQESGPAPSSLSRQVQEEIRVLSKSQLQVTLLHLIQVKEIVLKLSIRILFVVYASFLVAHFSLLVVTQIKLLAWTQWFLRVCFRLTAHSWTPFTKPTSTALPTTPAASINDGSHILSKRTLCPVRTRLALAPIMDSSSSESLLQHKLTVSPLQFMINPTQLSLLQSKSL